jgi:hypothetical protein
VTRRAAILAVFVGFIGTGAFFGYVDPPGSYGLHLKWRLTIHRHDFGFNFGVVLN